MTDEQQEISEYLISWGYPARPYKSVIKTQSDNLESYGTTRVIRTMQDAIMFIDEEIKEDCA